MSRGWQVGSEYDRATHVSQYVAAITDHVCRPRSVGNFHDEGDVSDEALALLAVAHVLLDVCGALVAAVDVVTDIRDVVVDGMPEGHGGSPVGNALRESADLHDAAYAKSPEDYPAFLQSSIDLLRSEHDRLNAKEES